MPPKDGDGMLYGNEPADVATTRVYLVMTGLAESFPGSVDSIWTDIERAHARRHELIQKCAGCDEDNVEVVAEPLNSSPWERVNIRKG